jgi:hypothetical protein
MEKSLFRLEVVPFLVQFMLLLLATAAGDVVLHAMGMVWVGRYLGIPGTLLILLALLYSLRKRKVIQSGNPRILLRMHEILTWLGAWMVCVHAGVHFNAVLPWLATLAMLINMVSGMVGRYLLGRSRQHMVALRARIRTQGLSHDEEEKELFWDAVTYELMTQWRAVHFPISLAFAVLALSHITSIFLFWEWP